MWEGRSPRVLNSQLGLFCRGCFHGARQSRILMPHTTCTDKQPSEDSHGPAEGDGRDPRGKKAQSHRAAVLLPTEAELGLVLLPAETGVYAQDEFSCPVQLPRKYSKERRQQAAPPRYRLCPWLADPLTLNRLDPQDAGSQELEQSPGPRKRPLSHPT